MWEQLDKDTTKIENQTIKRSNEYASYIMESVCGQKEVTVYVFNIFSKISFLENISLASKRVCFSSIEKGEAIDRELIIS